jgi:hypothetical protein
MRIDDARKLDLATDRVIVDLFAATTSKTGLKVGREPDPDSTPKAVATEEMARRDISPRVECSDRSLKPSNPNQASVSRQAIRLPCPRRSEADRIHAP